MGGTSGNGNGEISQAYVVEKLKNALKCIGVDETEFNEKPESAQNVRNEELFKARLEFMRGRQDINKMGKKETSQEEKLDKETSVDPEKKAGGDNDETVLNVVYPEKQSNVLSSVPSPIESTNKSGASNTSKGGYGKKSEPPMDKYYGMGLLQGPYLSPNTVELRNGKIMVGCRCVKRDGLQADCPRKMCGGKPTCVTLPLPGCFMSGYGRTKPRIPQIVLTDPTISCSKGSSTTGQIKEASKSIPIRRDYVDQVAPSPVPCRYHVKGRYYLRPLQRNKKMQTEFRGPPATQSSQELSACPSSPPE